ncbi:hypothetical protein [Mycobacterium sp. URHB0021]
MVFARRRSRIQSVIVEIGDVSSGFLQYVAMALRNDHGSQFVHLHRDPLLAYAAPNADPVHGRLHFTVRSPSAESAFTDVGWRRPGFVCAGVVMTDQRLISLRFPPGGVNRHYP